MARTTDIVEGTWYRLTRRGRTDHLTVHIVVSVGLVVAVIVVGATVLRPAVDDHSSLDRWMLLSGAAFDVVALSVATGLAVYKPGRTRGRMKEHAR
jgi:hypothetical protein